MSGEKFNKNISRKNFIKLVSASIGLVYLYSCVAKIKKNIQASFAGGNSKTGHLLRENKFPTPTYTKEINTVIVGGGVSGLSAAYLFKKNNFSDFILFELDKTVGGNAKSGKNVISEYPYGAHYLPIANEKDIELINFLKENNIITSFDDKGLPIYNEYYLCAEPEERMHLKGIWQNGIPAVKGYTSEEEKELIKFNEIIENYKNKTGDDGKPAFTIPLEWSSNDDSFLALDKISMYDFLKQHNLNSDFINWYINYCCKDDYGTDFKKTSAWAGIHYFAARNGKASNAASDEQLTWPEGNAFLVNCLKNNCNQHILNNYLVYKIEKGDNNYNCYVFDINNNKSVLYKCKNIVLATPQFVNKRILNSLLSYNFNEFNYYPWLVANITISDYTLLNGSQDLSWDNVMYNSKSLGYVNACHQHHNRLEQKTVITYYYNFSEKSAKEEREFCYSKDEEYWKNFVIDDLKKTHPSIEEAIEHIELFVYGHGMISPEVGFRSSTLRSQITEENENIYFVNSDVSGISIFEQAFYKGTEAAKKILKIKNVS